MTGFRPFFNPATGEWIEFTAIADDSNGQLVQFSWRSTPGGLITEHIHPRQKERFIITSGEARFTLDGEELTARAGETVVVPAGVRQSEGNPGPAEIKAVVELRPALRTSCRRWRLQRTPGPPIRRGLIAGSALGAFQPHHSTPATTT
jgi:mannose-6-phosphate isomerase-like protein (cupin superfamily)